MNKKELANELAKDFSSISQKEMNDLVTAVFFTVADRLAAGEAVAISGFGKFDIRKTAARVGRNPQTGAPTQIEAKTKPVFRAAQNLKDVVNKEG